jgi:hypothetical protein
VVAFAIGGGVALTLALSSTASADEVIVQEAEVVNAGAAVANSGGNVAVGNVSDNTATTNQAAVGLLASNNASTSNQSNGTASVTTGAATANGSVAKTEVAQDVTTGDDAGGVVVAVQDGDVVNAGAAVANSGLNAAVGNASDNEATTNQAAIGAIASNNANTSNTSDGTASVTTGAATATGNLSETGVQQSVDNGGGAGPVVVLVQDADVINAGFGLANSGLNFAPGNTSDNTATTNQLALGLLASNTADNSNDSRGTATITTGAATATGNASSTDIGQTIAPGGPPPPNVAVVVQSDFELNLGLGIANSGFNFPVANNPTNVNAVVQVAIGLLASNTSTSGNTSAGTAWVSTGAATANGNIVSTKIEQLII